MWVESFHELSTSSLFFFLLSECGFIKNSSYSLLNMTHPPSTVTMSWDANMPSLSSLYVLFIFSYLNLSIIVLFPYFLFLPIIFPICPHNSIYFWSIFCYCHITVKIFEYHPILLVCIYFLGQLLGIG